MTPNSWLLYNLTNSTTTTANFIVKFLSQGNWAGEGSVREDDNITGEYIQKNNTINQVQRRIDW
jgi:hypothetical protein